MDSLLFECWLKSYSILKVNFDSKFLKKITKIWILKNNESQIISL